MTGGAPTLPFGVEVTETSFQWGSRVDPVHDRRDLHRALLDWCDAHGLDPHVIPAGARIERDVARCRVVTTRIVVDENGSRRQDGGGELVTVPYVVQGETPPLPWPPEVARLIR